MQALLASIDNLLEKLPASGHKTTIGLAIQFALPLLVAKLPVLLLVAPLIDAGSLLLVAVGAAHRAVKQFNEERKEMEGSDEAGA